MKRTAYLVAMFATLAFTSCSREAAPGSNVPASETVTLTVEASEDGAKTYLGQDGKSVLWGTGEYLQLYYNDGANKFAKSAGSSADKYSGKAQASFDFTLSPASKPSYTIGGVYPESSVINVGGIVNNNPAAYKIALKSPQISKGGNYDPEAYVMVMKPETVQSLSGTVTAAFRRAVALNHFTLKGVKEKVKSVEIIAPGYALGGKREINLTTGESGEVYEPSESITVQFAEAQAAGTVEVWFTSWEVREEQTEELAVRVIGAENTYTKYIQAGINGLAFSEGKMNRITIDFSEIDPDTITLADFADPFANILSEWESTIGDVSVATGKEPEVHKGVKYLPSDLKINVGNLSLNKANMFDIALQGLVALNKGGKLSDKMPVPHSYPWGDNPYNELPGNGGTFANQTVGLDFLLNFCSRQSTYAQNNNIWSNLCGYAANPPQLAGYGGCCCLERGLLMLARFYEYLSDHDITEDIPTKCASMRLNAGLYDVAAGEVTLADFAKPFADILSVWESTTGDVSVAKGAKVYKDVQYLPSSLTIKVGNVSLNKAKMFDIALQGLVALNKGGKLSDKMPDARSYAWGDDTYNELPGNGDEFANQTVDLKFLDNFCTRQETYAKTNKVWANFCGYAGGQLSGYGGCCCLERGLLMLARFYEYLLTKKITDNIATNCSSMKLNAGLYAEATAPSATINDFAKAYVKVLSTWDSKTTTSGKVGTVTIKGHYVPASTKVTVNAKSYNKAQTYDIALQAMYKLLDGKSNLSTAMPEPSSIAKWSDDPYLENPEFTTASVTLNFLQNYASRQQNYLKTNKVYANFCGYGTGGATSSGTPQVSGFKGNCSLERSYLIMARFFKYIIDNKITKDFATALASVKFDAELYGEVPAPPTPPTPTDVYLKGGTYCDISSTTVKNAVAAAYKYYGTTASASASTRAKAIYKYALDKWNYKWYNNTSLGSNKMITNKLGNCCDMSHGIVAMCRCAGIRARYYHAQVYYKSSGRTGHVMAQIDMNNNADNPNWKIADATNNANTSIGMHSWTDAQSVKTYAILPF